MTYLQSECSYRCTDSAHLFEGGWVLVLNRPISVYHFLRGVLTLCPQLCMGIQLGARFPAQSADALSATLQGHVTQAIYRNEPMSTLPGLS